MSGRLAGEVALVTGAGRGFGAAIAKAFAAEGAAVTLFARSKDQLEAVAAEIEAAGGQALVTPGDVTQLDDVRRAVAATAERFGPVSVLVSNAGVAGPFGPVGDVDAADWWRAHTIHVKAPLMFICEVLPGMRAAGRGRIITVSSIAAKQLAPSLSAYSVGKCAQIRLVEHVAQEAAEEGVVAFAIEPGTVPTDMGRETVADADARKWLPGAVDYLDMLVRKVDPGPGLARCAAMCVDLASGDCDRLSGLFLLPTDDFATITRDEALDRTEFPLPEVPEA